MKRHAAPPGLRSCLAAALAAAAPLVAQEEAAKVWAARAELAQARLVADYWNGRSSRFEISRPADEHERRFHYWWQAHAVDVLVDGFERGGERRYLDRAAALWRGVREANGGATNDYYDDMLWMALALQRLAKHRDDDALDDAVSTLWDDVRRGWSDVEGGGVAWRKSQRDYKNAPANAPAVILGARRFVAGGEQRDLDFARRVDAWLTRRLVDPETGFVWDGVNRRGDGRVDEQWAFTYNQGTRIGALLALHRAAPDERLLREAQRTFAAARARLTDERGLLRERGDGDGALFKGILMRYVTELALTGEGGEEARAFVVAHAERLWSHVAAAAAANEPVRFPSDWRRGRGRRDELSAQLSAIMLLECAARLERQPRPR